MSGKSSSSAAAGDVAVSDVPPMRDLAFSMLSLLIDAAASQLRIEVSGAAPAPPPNQPLGPSNMREARAAIDAASALLGAVRELMEIDALRAVEGMLTQLQIEYVRLVGRVS